MLLAQRQAWVLKSAYGCEGEETICGPYVSDAAWRDAVTGALPHYWVAQRFFHAAVTPDGGVPNYGVYVVGGRSVGFFTRVATTATDVYAMTAPRSLPGADERERDGGWRGNSMGQLVRSREWWQAVDRAPLGREHWRLRRCSA